MSLPIIVLDNHEKWDCHMCGMCCRGSLVPLSKADVERLRNQKWEEEPDYRNVRIMVRQRGKQNSFRLAHRPDGSCVFLGEDGLCRIHAKLGLEAKPTICQTFPLQLVPLEKHAVLTTRRACPSAAADLGSDVSKYLPSIKKLVAQERLRAEPIRPPQIKMGEARDWKTARVVLECAGKLLQDQRYPPVRRVVHALQYAALLSKAKTRSLTDQQIAELARTLAELAPEESKPFFSDRQPPKSYSKILFRLMAIDCARLHPECRHRRRWSSRFQLIDTAWRILHSSGSTPAIDKIYPVTKFDEFEKPFGAMSPEIYLPLARFMETTSASYLYALADRRGWSIVESIQSLALLFPVGLWLLRWLTHGRQPTPQDMLNIIVALDRSQGFAPLGGSLHRWRLATLSFNSELERLVVWYAR